MSDASSPIRYTGVDGLYSDTVRTGPLSAKSIRERGLHHNPMDGIRTSNMPPRNDAENQAALARVSGWNQELLAEIERLKREQSKK